ncbi:antibiotic resistance efflux pump component [Neisseria zoodegmatis]|uniref:Antibiotic resistance efflux pump component n=1 Tax=Neisseria zoodegmatis TaxID=326523 RepID=A0A378WHH7_9NEIS|nr:efflux RND transporter periplasmic adaptor subunit [Neisseria zoodegmatis]SUA36367.1 antibiotic resistance efflux pump component [Neisseria zoodegmatis]
MNTKSKNKSRSAALIIALLILIAAVAYGVWLSAKPEPVVLQGRLEAQETDIAAKVPGRVSKIFVREGEDIQAGTQLIEMDSPEITAKIKQAQAAQEAAEAVARKAEHGARPQEIEMARAQWKRAQAAAELAEVSYRRIQNLANEGLMSRQKRDEAYTNHIASREQAAAAKAQYDMAHTGARSEDKEAAEAQAKQVAAKVEEAQVAQEEANLKSPINGQVADIMVEEGEIVPQGVPVVTLVDNQNQWVVLNVREDHLKAFALGNEFEATMPALSDKPIRFKVFASKVLADYATWRATRNNDGFDMRTFEIKARPIKPLNDARPGMSVLVTVVPE